VHPSYQVDGGVKAQLDGEVGQLVQRRSTGSLDPVDLQQQQSAGQIMAHHTARGHSGHRVLLLSKP
jgi:hypothetical protein